MMNVNTWHKIKERAAEMAKMIHRPSCNLEDDVIFLKTKLETKSCYHAASDLCTCLKLGPHHNMT